MQSVFTDMEMWRRLQDHELKLVSDIDFNPKFDQ